MVLFLLTSHYLIGKESTGTYEKLRGTLKHGAWKILAPDIDVETDNGVKYNPREMEDLIKNKSGFLQERRKELKKLVPGYKEPKLFIKRKKKLRVKKPKYQAARPKHKKTEEGKEDKGKGKAKAKAKTGGGDSGAKSPAGGRK